MTPAILCASDLDRTLIYSASAVERWPPRAPLTTVERYRDADASFVTTGAARLLADLAEARVLIPVTTRTVEQLARVRLPGRPPKWAVAANGGVLLANGRPDAKWSVAVTHRLRAVAAVDELAASARAACRPEWTRTFRVAEGLFCYAVLDRDATPSDFAATERDRVAALGWVVSQQGRKVYWVPEPLTKSAAVGEIARREGGASVIAAGDSLLDADLLDAASAGMLARHGELETTGWSRPHVRVTAQEGPDAGEEIARWFASQALGNPAEGVAN